MTDGDAPLLLIADKNRSSWSMCAWLALRHAGAPFTEERIPFATRGWRARVRELSPSGRVPALRVGGRWLWESLAICEYAAETSPPGRLWPEGRDARALARCVSAELVTGLSALRRELSMDIAARLPAPRLSAEAQADLARTFDLWRTCKEASAGEGPYLFGAFSIADALSAPAATRLRTYGVAADDAVTRAYVDALLDHPLVREWSEGAAREHIQAREGRDAGAPPASTAEECWAVIFTSDVRPGAPGYDDTAREMEALAREQPGFLGFESVRDGARGISISYWGSLAAVSAWKTHAEHQRAQRLGAEHYYDRYQVRVASVERAYSFERRRDP